MRGSDALWNVSGCFPDQLEISEACIVDQTVLYECSLIQAFRLLEDFP